MAHSINSDIIYNDRWESKILYINKVHGDLVNIYFALHGYF